MRFQDVIIPLKPEDVMDEYFLGLMNKTVDEVDLNLFIMGYTCD